MHVKSRKLGVATNSIVLAFVRCVTYASAFAQTMIMSRVFDKFHYGSYSQACLVANFITPFLMLGLGNAVNYFFNQESGKREEYVETIYNMVLILGIVGGISIMVLHNPIASYFSNMTLVPLLYIVAFRPLLQNMVAVYQVLYISSDKAFIIAIRNTVLAVVQFFIILVAAFFYENIELVLCLLVITDFIQVIIFRQHFSKTVMRIRLFKINFHAIPKIFVYALPLAFSTMIGTLSINIDTMLIGKLLSTEVFALYSNMAKELPFNFFITSFTDVVFPKIINLKSRGEKEKLISIYGAYIEIGIITTWILIGGAIVSAKELIIILYSEKYLEGAAIFIVYLLVGALRFTYYGMILSAYGKSKDIMYFSLITLVCNFIFNIILFYFMGIIGPAIATFITVFITSILQMRRGFKLLGSSFREVFHLEYLIKLLLTLFVLGVLFLYLKQCCPGLSVVVRFLVFYVFYVGIILFLNRKKLLGDVKLLNMN